MKDVDCPYCGKGHTVVTDDGFGCEEDVVYHDQCYHCDKHFALTVSWLACYEAEKAKCLNGGDHEWVPTHTYPVEYTKMRCTMCDERRSPTDEEMKKVLEEAKK